MGEARARDDHFGHPWWGRWTRMGSGPQIHGNDRVGDVPCGTLQGKNPGGGWLRPWRL